MRFNWKRLCLLAGLIALVILLVRGCLFARGAQSAKSGEPAQRETGEERMITLYDSDMKKAGKIPLEEYLTGVVAGEMPAAFHEEALKSQAVVARTYTLRKIEEGGCPSGYDICTSSKCCQAYDTAAACRDKWGIAYDANIRKVKNAVRQTRDEALYYGGELIEALYHAASGGQTEDSENVFASARPYLRGVKSENEVGSSHLTDTRTFTRKDFVTKINKNWPKAVLKAGKLESQLEVLIRYESGRVKTVQLGAVNVSGRELRGALGLPSAWFTITLTADNVSIHTRGYGHGVGMSQTGANGMAVEGADYREILAHYYTGAIIKSAALYEA
ncbi:MAG: stage II sporulation protein D [Clostridiales bacterium]|jgi:stage II sporulation protein D|nr:stage II sporulation protein D [Clostridiales bacterium]